MPQLDNITYLYPQQKRETAKLPAPIKIGKRYALQTQHGSAIQSVHGLLNDYRISTEAAEIVPLGVSINGEIAAYFWDADSDLRALSGDVITEDDDASVHALSACRLQNNRLELNRTDLKGPEIHTTERGALLTLSPTFEFSYTTDAFAARLGMLHLLQAKRFITLANGQQMTILDSGDEDSSILYLDTPKADDPMAWLSSDQPLGESQAYSVSVPISQAVPQLIDGETVESLTVLERYSSYLMQRALCPGENQTIWTPIYPPISWGWSIRAGCRSDGDWAIMRRKLMLPITGHDGLHLPLWNGNSQVCSGALDLGD